MSRSSVRTVWPADGAAKSSGLDRVVILIVDESLKTRALLGSILSSLGVGTVLRAPNGGNALELIQEMRRRPERVGVSGIDLIISEWDMASVDGATLLRWIRHHRESPDRFLPFIVMSATPSEGRVKAARDLGANQFIARPFTVNSLCDHIDSLVRDDRRYVKTGEYFGPDRRFHDLPVEMDRRADSGTEPFGVRFILPPRGLAAKVGGRLQVEPEMLAEAENELETWQEEFVATVRDYLDRLTCEYTTICGAEDAMARLAALDRLGRIGRQLHSHGQSFGFPLVTTVARSLHQLTGQGHAPGDDYLGLLGAHLDTIRAVLSVELRSDGGKVGRELVRGLHRANRKFLRAPEHDRPPSGGVALASGQLRGAAS